MSDQVKRLAEESRQIVKSIDRITVNGCPWGCDGPTEPPCTVHEIRDRLAAALADEKEGQSVLGSEEQAHQVRLSGEEPSPPGSFSPEASPPGSFPGSALETSTEQFRKAALVERARDRDLIRRMLRLMEEQQASDDDSEAAMYCRWCGTLGKWNGTRYVEPFEHAASCIVLEARRAVEAAESRVASGDSAEARHERLLNGESPFDC